MYDTHCHLDYFENPVEVIKESFNSGIRYLNTISIEIEQFDKIIKIANLDERIFCSIGQHPLYLKTNLDINKFENLFIENIKNFTKKIIAIGETGLDYFKKKEVEEKILQKKIFLKQIEISQKFNLPLIVHTRNAGEDTYDIIKQEKAFGLIHCFTENQEFLKRMLDLGFYISFSGIVTFKNAVEIQTCAKYCPLDRILIETDAPYLSPNPFRGKENKPIYIKHTTEFIANLKDLKLDEFIEIATRNAKKIFQIESKILA